MLSNSWLWDVVSRLLQSNDSKATLDLCCWQLDLVLWFHHCCHHFQGLARLLAFSPNLVHLLQKSKTPRFELLLRSTRTLTLDISEIFYESNKQRKRAIDKYLPKIASSQSSLVTNVVPRRLKPIFGNFTHALCTDDATLPSNYWTDVAQNWTLNRLAV